MMMNRVITVALAAIVIFGSAACGKDKTGSVTVVFKGTYGDDPLVMFDKYAYAFGEEIQFTKSDFYVSNVVLGKPSGLAEVLIDVELVDLSFTSEADAMAGAEFTIDNVPALSYNRFDFAIGLDPEMNASVPADWPASHPLSEPRYWDAWSSYIFAKMEGNLDTLNTGNADLGWLYHTGTDKLYISLSTNSQFNVTDGGNTRITFTLDHKSLFGVGAGPVDIKNNPINHNPTDSIEITKIVENYTKSITFLIE
jgi:hypothetical protein